VVVAALVGVMVGDVVSTVSLSARPGSAGEPVFTKSKRGRRREHYC